VLGYIAFKAVYHSQIFGLDSGGLTAFFGQLFVVFILCMLYNMYKKQEISNVFSTMFVLVYPVSMMVYMLALNYLPDDVRIMAILLTFLISSLTDVFAYLVGRTLKGPKLAPNISPNKTISGAVGGLMGAVIGAMIVLMLGALGLARVQLFGAYWIDSVPHLTVIALLGSVANQMGDLIASFIKRSCGYKDFGSLLPGHGGVLDRVDGMMLVAVVVFGYITIWGMVGVAVP
jgi:phosphatidate cytidylyltransferase